MLLQAGTEAFHGSNEYNNLNKTFLEFINKNGQSNKWLLMPTDMKNTLSVIKNYEDIYKKFIEKRKFLKKGKEKNELHKLYLHTFKRISQNMPTDSIQLTSRHDYEMRILKELKKDLNEERFLDENKDLLMIDVKKILLVNKFMIYETQKRKNIFYAQNIKRYIAITAKVPLHVVTTSEIYMNFLNLLKKGETLILEGINCNSFEEFEKFIEELEVSDEDIQRLLKVKDKNPSIFIKIYIDYWIRGQVYGRYLKTNEVFVNELKFIKKEKTFFEDL
jgi:hypothetical protein